MEPKQRRGRRTAGRVLDAAEGCLVEGGPAGLTIDALVARSGVSVGSIYHHFGSMDGVAAGLYQRCMGSLMSALVEALSATEGPQAGVNAVVTAYLEWTRAHPAHARFIHSSGFADYVRDHAEAIQASKAGAVGRLMGWLSRYVAAGEVVELPVGLYEIVIIGPVAEVARRWLSSPEAVDLDAAIQVLPGRIWAALRAQSGG